MAAALVFTPGLGGDFVWDDNVLIRNNEHVRSLAGLKEAFARDFWFTSEPSASSEAGYYRPVVKAAWVLEYLAFGGSPLGFRAVNLLLHLCCVVLAGRWVARRLAAAGSQPAGPAVGLAAAISMLPFALHPSRPESVAWISGGTDLWMAFLVLLGLEAWDRRRTVLAAAAFVAALFAKETALVVPLLLALDAALLRPPGKAGGFRPVAAVAASVALAFAARSAVIPPRYAPILGDGSLALALRAAASFGFYLQRLVAPASPSTQAGVFPIGAVAVATGFLGAGLLAVAVALSVRRRGLRPYLADAAWLAGPLLPVLNIVPLHYKMFASERFLYLPMLGVCALVGRGIRPTFGRRRLLLAAGAVVAAAAVFWGTASAEHVGHFDSDLALWSYERRRDPRNAYAAEMLARTAWDERMLADARQAAEDALRLAATPDEQAQAAALWVFIEQEATPDWEQARLSSLRELLDGLAQPDGHPTVSGPIPPRRLDPSPKARAKLTSSVTFRTQRAILHARTTDLLFAEAEFRALVAAFPQRPAGWANLARVLAWKQDWTAAQAVLADAQSRFPADSALASLERRVDEVARRIGGLPPGSEERLLATGEGMIQLGAEDLGRRHLEPVLAARPDDPALVRWRVRYHLAGDRPDLARQSIDRARQAAPKLAAEAEALLLEH